MRVDSGPEAERHLAQVAPNAGVLPVIQVGDTVLHGFPRDRLSRLVGVRAQVEPPPGAWSEAEQMNREVQAASLNLAQDLELARRIHKSLIPPDFDDGYLQAAARLRPRIGVGGDYCSVFRQGAGRYYMTVCDVTGHGVASALLVSRINSFVLARLPAAPEPARLMEALNVFLCDHFGGIGLFATFFVARIDCLEGFVDYASAGHPPALVLRPGEEAVRLGSNRPPLGISRDPVAVPGRRHGPIAPGEALVLYTDGVIEAAHAGEQFGTDRLIAEITAGLEGGPAAAAERVLAAVARHEPGPASDDRLVLVARLLGKASGRRTG